MMVFHKCKGKNVALPASEELESGTAESCLVALLPSLTASLPLSSLHFCPALLEGAHSRVGSYTPPPSVSKAAERILVLVLISQGTV